MVQNPFVFATMIVCQQRPRHSYSPLPFFLLYSCSTSLVCVTTLLAVRNHGKLFSCCFLCGIFSFFLDLTFAYTFVAALIISTRLRLTCSLPNVPKPLLVCWSVWNKRHVSRRIRKRYWNVWKIPLKAMGAGPNEMPTTHVNTVNSICENEFVVCESIKKQRKKKEKKLFGTNEDAGQYK